MFVDLEFYTNVYDGIQMNTDEFKKYCTQACMYISANTLSRVTDSKIGSYPEELQNNIKYCACALTEYFKQTWDAKKSISVGADNDGIVMSKTAGAVTVTYDTRLTAKYFIEQESQSQAKYQILKQYLYPMVIDGKMYNLLSKSLNGG